MQHILIIGAGAIRSYFIRELRSMYLDLLILCIDAGDGASHEAPAAWVDRFSYPLDFPIR